MLKIKDNVDLKELEKFGFRRLEDDLRDHKYSWKYELKGGFYELSIARDNRLGFYLESYCNFNYLGIKEKLFDKLYDLIKADLVEKVDN